jgi:hypothetical protein
LAAESGTAPRLLDWGVAAAALTGQATSGDRHLVRPYPNGVLAGVVDGLGHGEEAAAAAMAAIAILDAHASESVLALAQLCHAGLRGTRGVVMSLASFRSTDSTMTWLGVGNVDGVLLRADPRATPARETLLLRGGVVGYQLPALHASAVPVARGDTLVLVTDGIRSGFAEQGMLPGSTQQMADRILQRFNKRTDDALALVVQYLGTGP